MTVPDSHAQVDMSRVGFDVVVGAYRSPSELVARSRETPSSIVFSPAINRIAVDGSLLSGRPQTVRMLGLLLCGRGSIVSHDDLIDGMWGDRDDGGPIDASHFVLVLVTKARAVAARIGISIVNEWGRGYRACLAQPALQAAE